MAHIDQRLLQEGGSYGDKKWHGSFNQVFHLGEVCNIILGGGITLVIIVFSRNFVYCTFKITNIEVDLIRSLLLFVGVISVLVGNIEFAGDSIGDSIGVLGLLGWGFGFLMFILRCSWAERLECCRYLASKLLTGCASNVLIVMLLE